VDFDFDFEEIWDEYKLYIIIGIIIILGGAGAYLYMGHGGKGNTTTTPTENYDFVMTSLPDYMTIMGNIVNGNVVSMPLGATKVYAYGFIASYVVSGTSTNVLGLNTVSLFMSGESDPSNYILYIVTGSNAALMESYFKVNGTDYLYVSSNNSSSLISGGKITSVPINEEFFSYSGVNAQIITVSGQKCLLAYKTVGSAVYMWYFASNRIVFDVTRVENGTTTESLMYVQVQAPSDMWATQSIP